MFDSLFKTRAIKLSGCKTYADYCEATNRELRGLGAAASMDDKVLEARVRRQASAKTFADYCEIARLETLGFGGIWTVFLTPGGSYKVKPGNSGGYSLRALRSYERDMSNPVTGVKITEWNYE